ncbi:MAG: hypothetical protein RBS78_03425 [Coriobacteriia bacterium]|nr:hypothetical protein [Coriobacteriia bacterium]
MADRFTLGDLDPLAPVPETGVRVVYGTVAGISPFLVLVDGDTEPVPAVRCTAASTGDRLVMLLSRRRLVAIARLEPEAKAPIHVFAGLLKTNSDLVESGGEVNLFITPQFTAPFDCVVNVSGTMATLGKSDSTVHRAFARILVNNASNVAASAYGFSSGTGTYQIGTFSPVGSWRMDEGQKATFIMRAVSAAGGFTVIGASAPVALNVVAYPTTE